MRAVLAAALVAGASTAAAAAAGPIPGVLVGLYALGDSLSNLTLLSIDPNTGANATLGYVSLGPIKETFPARSVYDDSTGQLLVAVETATNVFGVDVTTGAVTPLAALPNDGGADPYLALLRVNGVNYFVTQSNLYILDHNNTVLRRVSALHGLPDDAVATANPASGTNGEGILYLGNATIPHHNSTLPPYIWRVDLGKDNAVDYITPDATALWNLRYTALRDTLLAFVPWYNMTFISPADGTTTYLEKVADGPGYPKINAMDPTGRWMTFFDFESVHTIDLSVSPPAYTLLAPFYGTPRGVGYPVWVPAPTAA